VPALVADVEVTPEQLGPAGLEIPEHPVLLGGEYIPLPVGRPVGAENVRYLDGRP